MQKILTKNEKETIDFASDFAQKLKGGEVIGLQGDLGAGKTVFAKGMAKGLKIKDNINSPTFVLMKVYDISKNKIKKFVHIDAYRIKRPEELEAVGALEYMNRADTITLIEWVENIERIIPQKIKKIKIKTLNKKEREIIIKN